ncbi:MAG: nicotinamide mononucleotide transporter [Gammaproteobacteria bacterium]|nr:nicotinamide mononucleotide transporter [Gammaproteobacteria bacterium]MBQ0840654.1 nicotinamide mononucleotide transporter [Gammaproteobacteria bacterium]
MLATSFWELLAVLLAIAYLLLALRENSLCWYCAFVSTAIFTALFWDVSLLMESALNVYYMAMAVYGWWQWRGAAGADTNSAKSAIEISAWPLRNHLLAWGGIGALTLVSGSLLANNTTAALPYLDSFTTWGSVLTTWMVTRKILENWLYWIVIDAISIFLYLDRGLHLTSLLFVAYVIIVVFGFFAWRKRMVVGEPADLAVQR